MHWISPKFGLICLEIKMNISVWWQRKKNYLSSLTTWCWCGYSKLLMTIHYFTMILFWNALCIKWHTLKKNNGPEQRQHVCISLARQLTNNIGLKQLGTTSNMQNKSHTFCWIFLCMFMIFIYLQNHRCISIKTFEITQIKTRGLQLRLKS